MTPPKPTPAGLWFPIQGADIPEDRLHEGVFLPHPLPADVVLDSRTHQLLATAEQALGRLDEAARRLPDRKALIQVTQVREIQRSARLDDVYGALREVIIAGLDNTRGGSPMTPVLSRYLMASELAFGEVSVGADIDLNLLHKISNEFRERDTPGAGSSIGPHAVNEAGWRDEPGWLGPTLSEAYLLISPPSTATQEAATRLIEWNAADCALPLVGKLALGYLQFVLVQPFAFGNGHLSRLYVGLELVRTGVLRGQLLPISAWLDEQQDEHRLQIRHFVETGDFAPWIRFFAAGILKVSLDQVRLVEQLEDARDALLKTLDKESKGRIGSVIRDVVTDFIAVPITNHKQIAQRHHIHTSTAINVTTRLTNAGVIEILGNKKYGKTFMVDSIMRVLARTSTPPPPAEDGNAFSDEAGSDPSP